MVHDDDGNYGNGTKPHPHPITIYSIRMTTVPVFSMNRSDWLYIGMMSLLLHTTSDYASVLYNNYDIILLFKGYSRV